LFASANIACFRNFLLILVIFDSKKQLFSTKWEVVRTNTDKKAAVRGALCQIWHMLWGSHTDILTKVTRPKDILLREVIHRRPAHIHPLKGILLREAIRHHQVHTPRRKVAIPSTVDTRLKDIHLLLPTKV
jgi:hypothetical protein